MLMYFFSYVAKQREAGESGKVIWYNYYGITRMALSRAHSSIQSSHTKLYTVTGINPLNMPDFSH